MAGRKKTDLDRLQGTWYVSALEIDGMRMGTIPPGACITVEGSRFTTRGMGAEYEGDVSLESAAMPKRFDLAFTTGPEQGNSALGIYELDGDTWKMCLTTRGGMRPVEFATKAGTGHALQTLLREGSAKLTAAATTAAPPGDAAPELDGEWTMESIVIDGHPLPPSLIQMGRRLAKDGELRVMMGPQTVVEAKFAVDRSRTPMEMNYVYLRGGQVQLGIYSLQGNMLTTCLGKPGGDRPATFASVVGDGRTLTVWKKKG